MTGVLSVVLDAAEHGATTRAQIAQRTGLDRLVVDACVDHLVRAGRIGVPSLSSGCPDSGCGGCASTTCASAPLHRRS